MFCNLIYKNIVAVIQFKKTLKGTIISSLNWKPGWHSWKRIISKNKQELPERSIN